MTVPRLRSRHKGTEYRTALRAACAVGDDHIVWIQKMSIAGQTAFRRTLDQLFDDPPFRIQRPLHEQRPKAQHPWNRSCRLSGTREAMVAAGTQLEDIIMSESTQPENTLEPPMRTKVPLPAPPRNARLPLPNGLGVVAMIMDLADCLQAEFC